MPKYIFGNRGANKHIIIETKSENLEHDWDSLFEPF